jgi:putative transposase
VRFDPFDAGTAYAFVRGAWVKCHSEYYSVLRNRSEREIKVATEELRKRRKLHSQQFNVTAKKLAEFLESVEDEEKLLAQRLRDRESQHILSQINDKSDGSGSPFERNAPLDPTVSSNSNEINKGSSRRRGKKDVQDDVPKLKTYGRF